MKQFFLLPLFTLTLWFSNLLPPENYSHSSNTPSHIETELQNVIGYQYNIWALKAEYVGSDRSNDTSKNYEFTGRVFLDKRKNFKSTFNKNEHSFLYKENMKDGEVYYFNDRNNATTFLRTNQIGDYYIILKCMQAWYHHKIEDIIKNKNRSVGAEVDCPTCNYKKKVYDLEKDWALTLYYEIYPIYKEGYVASTEE